MLQEADKILLSRRLSFLSPQGESGRIDYFCVCVNSGVAVGCPVGLETSSASSPRHQLFLGLPRMQKEIRRAVSETLSVLPGLGTQN